MTRTKARELAIRLIYAQAASDSETLLEDFLEPEHFESLASEDELFSEKPEGASLEYISRLLGLCRERRAELDGYIEKYSHGWRPERITRTAAAVLRCAMAEALYIEDAPLGAAINEAVELAKCYEEPETVAFINGVLGGFARGEGLAPETAE